MDSKRQSQHEGDESVQTVAQPSKRRREDSQQSGTCIIGRSVLNIETDIVPAVEGLARRVVREEVESQLLLRSITETGPCGGKSFKLIFKNDLPATIFTHSNIKAKDGRLVEIALYNTRTQSFVTDGSLSSIKIKICVLKGEFGSNGSEDWTTDKFKANISRERENKGKLLKGDTVITLENGVGHITEVMFTDNSKRTRSRHFRLGAIVVSTSSDEGNIREAISNRFMVKECRRELNQKHYPPSLNDEVYRLENISKDGKIHERLSEIKVNTVKDLLQLRETNPSLLREKFGRNSTKLRETIQHAKTCNTEVTSDGQNYRSRNTLNSDEKQLEKVQQHAYRNVEDFIPDSFPGPLASQQIAGQFSAPCLQLPDLPTAQQALTHRADQLEKRQDFGQPSTSTSHTGEATYNNQVGFAELLSGICMEGNDSFLLGPHVPIEVPDVYSTENDFQSSICK